MTPAAKKAVVSLAKTIHNMSERRACLLFCISRTATRYVGISRDDEAVKSRLKELAVRYPRYGYLLLHGLLKAEGLVDNKKRTYRLYTELGLQVRTKQRKKLIRPRIPISLPNGINERWSMDFVSDQLASGKRFRVLNVVDDYSRECIGQLADVSLSGEQVSRFLKQLIAQRQRPQSIVCDNGPEFTSKAMFFWSKSQDVKLSFIQPGKPTQNAFVESFNGKFRDACLNQHWFRDLHEARQEIAHWRTHYNEVRPHSSLNYLPPSEFAKRVA